MSAASHAPVIVWFRQDLRLADNPALCAAAEAGAPVLPVYVLDDETPGEWAMGGASRWWLHKSLESFAASLKDLGAPLLLRKGNAAEIILRLAEETGAKAVYWNRCYEPFAIERDTALKADLKGNGIEAESFNAALLYEPWTVQTKSGDPYKVFSPFWRSCMRDHAAPEWPVDAPAKLEGFKDAPSGDKLSDWNLLPTKPDWAGGLRDAWTPGEDGARARLDRFFREAADAYKDTRDLPGTEGTTGLSPHLHFGEIGPRQVYWAARAHADKSGTSNKSIDKFVAELGWREFSHHLLFHFPHIPTENFQDKFDGFPWRDDAESLEAWQRGETGYPMVDAGMRELWHTGWMHNRVRMIVASFLVKHLLIHWREGEAWFWDTLVDADLANNSASWQWVAGSGADAAPYFRIFNPITQGEKFDPDGVYIRRWILELAKLDTKHIHAPWKAPQDALEKAGVTLGKTYPEPIVDHGDARERALSGFDEIKQAS